MKLPKKDRGPASIPGASMSDIVFTLLLFFMVSTVLVKYDGLKVEIPEAFKIEKLISKTHTAYIWIDRAGLIVFDDYPISSINDVETIARQKITDDPQLIVFIRVDKDAPMKYLSGVQQQLREAYALRIFYGTKFKASAQY